MPSQSYLSGILPARTACKSRWALASDSFSLNTLSFRGFSVQVRVPEGPWTQGLEGKPCPNLSQVVLSGKRRIVYLCLPAKCHEMSPSLTFLSPPRNAWCCLCINCSNGILFNLLFNQQSQPIEFLSHCACIHFTSSAGNS